MTANVVLQPYGSLFFAAAPVFEEQLPRVTAASSGSVVIIRLRGEQELGSTFITVRARYRDQLDEAGSALMLAGLGDRVYRQLETTGVLTTIGPDFVFTATPRVTESLRQALTAAQTWRATRPGDPGNPTDPLHPSWMRFGVFGRSDSVHVGGSVAQVAGRGRKTRLIASAAPVLTSRARHDQRFSR